MDPYTIVIGKCGGDVALYVSRCINFPLTKLIPLVGSLGSWFLVELDVFAC